MHDLFREADRLMAVTFQKEGSPPHHYHYPSLLTFKATGGGGGGGGGPRSKKRFLPVGRPRTI